MDQAGPGDESLIELGEAVLGGGVGPWLVGRMSDALRPEHGELGIRYALLTVALGGVIAAGLAYLLAARTLPRDLARAET